ncbi:MAG: hypothetical protein LBK43_07125 [Treponema sp.]|jgi:4-hydroxy-3-methylbut-2-enyl diphosphate reductase IspH|nr:hypothetical protein [Treponema sp.]
MALEGPGKYRGKKIVTYEKIDFEGIAIIRAHGIQPSARSELVKAGWAILDATCPHIRESQKWAEVAFQSGSEVVLLIFST